MFVGVHKLAAPGRKGSRLAQRRARNLVPRLARWLQKTLRMTQPIDPSFLDAGWDDMEAHESPSELASQIPPSSGVFGHPRERRLGLRVPSAMWALLRDGERGIYARVVELSPTGTVLKLMSDAGEIDFERGGMFELTLFVPGAGRPVQTTVRPVRTIGELIAFEFSTIAAVDRLTLAEHLDRQSRTKASRREAGGRPRQPPSAGWRAFVLAARTSAHRSN